MGWSCAVLAGNVVDAWSDYCRANWNNANTYEVKGVRYFFDTSRKEHNDGAITGSIYKMLDQGGRGYCKLVGTFRVEGDGTVTRAPAVLKALKPRPYVHYGIGSNP